MRRFIIWRAWSPQDREFAKATPGFRPTSAEGRRDDGEVARIDVPPDPRPRRRGSATAFLFAAVWLLFVSATGAAGQGAADTDPRGTWYPAEALNSGLGSVPDEIRRATPQGALGSFLDAAERQDFAAAAHALNLNGIPPDDQSARGPDLARKLHTVLSRQAVISWRSLLERPDALDANAASEDPMAGEARRSILIGVLDLPDREAAIRLSRVRAGEAEPVWVFSERTVGMIPALHDRYGPSDFERALPDWAKQEVIRSLSWWEIAGIPILLALTGLLGAATYRALSWLANAASGRWRPAALRALRWPVVTAIVVTVISIAGERFFVLSGAVSRLLEPLVVGGYAFAILLFALRLIDAIMERMTTFDAGVLMDPDRGTSRSTATFLSGLRRALIVAFVLTSVVAILQATNLFRTLGFSLLASAGLLTLVFGFAARHVLGNIVASLQIALNNSARIGDQVYFEDQWCTVERIYFTYVQLLRWDGVRLIVPVAEFVGDTFVNLTSEQAGMTRTVVLTLANEFDIAPLRRSFRDLVADRDDIVNKDNALVRVVGQDAIGQKVRFQFDVPDPSTGWAAECDLREALIAEARAEERKGASVFPEAAVEMGAA
jgi:small-conductance mechanosensitive channel